MFNHPPQAGLLFLLLCLTAILVSRIGSLEKHNAQRLPGQAEQPHPDSPTTGPGFQDFPWASRISPGLP